MPSNRKQSAAQLPVLFVCFLLGHAWTADAVNSAEVDFEKQIAPLLINQCLSCHNQNDHAGGLDLTHSKTAFAVGESGEVAIVPGRASMSYLLERIEQGEMPPEGKAQPVTKQQLQQLSAWIDAGAAWPEKRTLSQYETTTDKRAGYDWWSLQTVERPTVPAIDNAWINNPIDAFVLRKLTASGLQPASPVDKQSLLRRITFDLTGLPPTLKEMEQFAADTKSDAYERLVDRLLASPRYGERWGRHWLDVAHYADTHGFERDMRRDHAWPYRDYVIRSFNEDKPYNQFIKEQIAGDAIDPRDPEKIIATGFLAAGPWDFVGNEENKAPKFRRQARADDLDDVVTTAMTATVGLTVNCARCHDHKFDPISTEDYYRLTAVFSGTERGDRDLPESHRMIASHEKLKEAQSELAKLAGQPVSLADIVGGGNGLGSGRRGHGIDVRTGQPTTGDSPFLDGVKVNQFVPVASAYIDGVFVPDGEGEVIVSSTGLKLAGLADTAGRVWDHVKFGPSLSPQTTVAEGIDYAAADHAMIGLHANKGITFDLVAIRAATGIKQFRFQAIASYGGAPGAFAADAWVVVDGQVRASQQGMKRNDPALKIDLALTDTDRFLTLIATDGGNDISHDQIFFGDPRLVPVEVESKKTEISETQRRQREELRRQVAELKANIATLPVKINKVYAANSRGVGKTHILKRGSTESLGRAVAPGALTCVQELEASLAAESATDVERRLALAEWIVDPRHPLTRRVAVNRLWHYHFGKGLVDTPSDFGFLGGRPSHPELLDWLADEFLRREWSIKGMHRLIVLSSTYQQSGQANEHALKIDAGNRLLWRRDPRRLEAEIVRDAVLASSGKLNLAMGGPGYRDFQYIQQYAPIYRYVTADKPELWRRSVYRYTVRSVPNQFMEVLDCPNPSNLAPDRARTTTALQSLTLLNDPFMIAQATYLAERIKHQAGNDSAKQAQLLYRLTLSREITSDELATTTRFLEENSLFHLCRVIINTNEFLYVD